MSRRITRLGNMSLRAALATWADHTRADTVRQRLLLQSALQDRSWPNNASALLMVAFDRSTGRDRRRSVARHRVPPGPQRCMTFLGLLSLSFHDVQWVGRGRQPAAPPANALPSRPRRSAGPAHGHSHARAPSHPAAGTYLPGVAGAFSFTTYAWSRLLP